MGWDVDRFPGEVDSELICCICKGILEDPVESPCRHAFCSVCVKPWLNQNVTRPQCRNQLYERDLKPVLPILKNVISKQKIYCEYKENGCYEIVSIEALERHIENCSFRPVEAQGERTNENISTQATSAKVKQTSQAEGKTQRTSRPSNNNWSKVMYTKNKFLNYFGYDDC